MTTSTVERISRVEQLYPALEKRMDEHHKALKEDIQEIKDTVQVVVDAWVDHRELHAEERGYLKGLKQQEERAEAKEEKAEARSWRNWEKAVVISALAIAPFTIASTFDHLVSGAKYLGWL